MKRLSRFYQLLVALVLMTSTPGVSELIEGAAHMALEMGGAVEHGDVGHCGTTVGHDDDGDCGDSCPTGGCTRGFFHSCRADAPVVATSLAPHMLDAPRGDRAIAADFGTTGRVMPGFSVPPFRPPCA